MCVTFMIGFILLVISCSKSEEVEPLPVPVVPEVNISVADLVFPDVEAKSCIFAVTSNVPWKMSLSNTQQALSWCKVEPMSGNKGVTSVTVTICQNNEDYDDRSTNLKIEAGDASKIISVTQKKKNSLILSKDKFEVGPNESTLQVDLKTNVSYTVEIPEEYVPWIIKKTDSGTRALQDKREYFTIREGNIQGARIGLILFRSGEFKDTVTVFQTQKDALILAQNTYSVTHNATSIDVELRTNVEYQVQIPSEAGWIKQSQTRAMRSDILQFSVDENEGYTPRTASIVIKDKNSSLTDILTIRQDPNPGQCAITQDGKIKADVENYTTLAGMIEYVKANIWVWDDYTDNDYVEKLGEGTFRDNGFTMMLGELPDRYLEDITYELEDFYSLSLQISDKRARVSSFSGITLEAYRGTESVGEFYHVKKMGKDFYKRDDEEDIYFAGGIVGVFVYADRDVSINGSETWKDEYNNEYYHYKINLSLRKGWNEIFVESKKYGDNYDMWITANKQPDGMIWEFFPNTTPDDYYGNYDISYKTPYGNYESTTGVVKISPYEDEGGGEWIFIEGLYEGVSAFTAYGEWQPYESCFLLYGSLFSRRTFYFTDEPNTLYYAAYYPVHYDPTDNYVRYLSGGKYENGEARLMMNVDGTLSYLGFLPDKDDLTANGFIYRYYSMETDEYRGYLGPCYDITLTPNYAPSARAAAANSRDNNRSSKRRSFPYWINSQRNTDSTDAIKSKMMKSRDIPTQHPGGVSSTGKSIITARE